MPPVAVPPLHRVRHSPGGVRAAGCRLCAVRRRRVAAGRGVRPPARCTSGPTRTDGSSIPISRRTGNVKVESINAPPPPADPNAVKDLANKEAELQKKKQVRADDDAKANKARVEANMRREECDRARGQAIALAQIRPGRALHHECEGRAHGDGRRRARSRSGSGSTTGSGRTARTILPTESRCTTAAAGCPARSYFFSRLAWLISTLALAFSVLT